ncbi:MAG: hypothetical protein MJH09_09045, partial [Cetobacterium sp.]|nr:hypothetical protein [Cetobacterium sp.]
MFKYLYKWLMVLFLLFSGMVYGAPEPGNAIIGTQATLTYTDTNAQEVTVQSNTVEVTVNEVRGVQITPDVANYSARPGEYIAFPITVNNRGNVADIYKIYTANDANLPEISFTIDSNGNGVIDAGETTVLQPYENLPSINGGESISLVVRGRISPTATIGSTQTFIPHARSITDGAVIDWNNNNFSIENVANVMVEKKFGATGVADALLYMLEITNTSDVAATDLVITDVIPNDLEFDTSGGVWTPFGSNTAKNVTYADDGPEATSNDVELKVVDGVLTFKVFNVPANFTGGGANGRFVFRMKPKAGVAPGTKITNIASYVYNNSSTVTAAKNTNFLVYEVPVQAEGVEIINEETLDVAAGDYITIPQTVINRGQVDDRYNLSVEQTSYIENAKFYIDENGDGIKNSNEDTEIGVTPVINEGESINILMVGKVSGGTPLGTQTFRIYARSTNFNQSDYSDITMNVFQAGELVIIEPDKTRPGTPGGQVMAHQIVRNISNENNAYYLYVDDPNLLDVKFFLDDNNDGVRQNTENTQITAPLSVNAGAEKHIFMVATLPSTVQAGSNKEFRIYARSIYNQNILDWSNITVNIQAAGPDVNIVKSLGTTSTPGAFVYVFEIENNGAQTATDIVLTDNLPNGIVPDSTDGRWFPASGGSKNVTLANDGYEPNSNDIDLSVTDGLLTLKLTSLAPGGSTTLHLRVRPTAGVASGSVLENTANYNFKDQDGNNQVDKTTNTVAYTVPSRAIVGVKKEAIADPNDPSRFIYKFKFLNTGDMDGTDVVLLDSLPDTVEIVGTTAQWQPVTWTTEKTITLANDGPEVVSDEVNLYSTNDGIRDTIHFRFINGLQANTTEATDGGILKIWVKPKANVAPGTRITNVAEFSYNDRVTGVVSGQLSSQAEYTVPEPVRSVDIMADETYNVAKGEIIHVPQTIKNTGETADTYTIKLNDNNPTDVIFNEKYYIDDNGDGILQYTETNVLSDGNYIATSPEIAAGGELKIIVVGLVNNLNLSNGVHTFGVIAESQTDTGVKDETTITLNVGAAGALVNLTPDLGLTVTRGSEIVVPQTVINKTANADTYNLELSQTPVFTTYKFISDDNGDGVRQANETTEITVTPSVGGNNGEFKFFLVGTLRNDLQNTEVFRIFAKSTSNNQSLDWSTITLTVVDGPDVNIVKSLGTTSTPGAFVYVFEFSNTGNQSATDIILTDNLPNGIVPDSTDGRWFPASGGSKNVSLAANGYEPNSDDIDLSVVNGVMTLKLKSLAVNANATLHLRVRPIAGVAPGTDLSNTANYNFKDQDGNNQVNKTTNTVTYTVPSQALFGVDKMAEVDPNDSTRFIFKFKVFNTGDTNATSVVITDTLPTEVEVVGTTAQWSPVGQSVEKTITLADDGQETISDEVNLKVVNGVMTFTITSVAANHPENGTGGLLKLYVKPKSTVASGTVISNTAEFSYNNGSDGTVTNRNSSTATYTVPSLGLGVDIMSNESYDVAKGEVIHVPQTIKNIGAAADTYTIKLNDNNPTDVIFNEKYYIDDNGDGILQYTETNVLSNGNYIATSPEIAAGGELKIIVVGLVNNINLSDGTHTFGVIAESQTNSTIKDETTITLNVADAGELVSIQPDVSMTVGRGTSIIIPQTIINKTNSQQTYSLDLSQTPVFLDYKYVIDDNGDGVREGNEVTEFTTTPVIPGNGQLKFFLIGTLRGDLGNSEAFRIFARSTTNANALDWTTVNLTITDPPTGSSNIVIDKSIGTSSTPGTFVYVFDIRNTSSTASGVVELVDEFPAGIEPDSQFGRWFPVSGGSKDVNSDDNGLEPNSNDIAFIYKNNKMTLKIVTMPGNSNATLHFRVRPVAGVTPGTVFENTAFYRYEPTPGVFPTVDAFTNTATYTVPSQALATVRKEAIADPNDSSRFIYKFKFTNTGDVLAGNFTMEDALPDNVEVVGTTAQWQPIGWTTDKAITYANDGPEVVSDEVNLHKTNDGVRDTIHFSFVNGIQPNTTNATDGGILRVWVKPKAGVAAGTTITNVARYSYNNGSGTVSDKVSNTAYYVVNDAAVNITKSIGETAVPGAFVYVFDMVNVGTTNSGYVSITDQLPEGIIPDISSGVWVAPSGNNISISIADDGIEPGAGDVEFSVVNGRLSFLLNSLGAGKSAKVVLRVRPESTVAPGTKVTNQADYSFQTSTGFTYYRTTNIVEYVIPGEPAGAGVVVEKSVQANSFPGTYKYRFFIKNPTSIQGSNLTITDTLPTGIDFYEADAKWVPQGSTDVKERRVWASQRTQSVGKSKNAV